MQLGKKPTRSAAPAGMALARLAGEDSDRPKLSFEEMMGAASGLDRLRPVDDEAVNKCVDQFRGHIKTVLHVPGSEEMDEFIGCMGFSEEEIKKWNVEEKKAEESAARGSRLTQGAEDAIRAAEHRRKQVCC